MKLLKNIMGVAISNITSFGTSFIIGFILPAVLSIAEYGYYKEYTLYLSFAYLFNLGFNDGIYIKYGGKNLRDLDNQKIQSEHNFILLFQIALMLLAVTIFAIQGSMTLVLFSLAALFVNMNTYHQNFLQATGNFSIYSRGNILKSIVYVLILLFGIFIVQSNNYVFYIGLNILSVAFLTIFYESFYAKRIGLSTSLDLDGKAKLFRIGIFILIANMSLTFVGNVGSWVVNYGFSIEEFAQYSFQNSLLNVILLIINAVGMVFYNVIAKNRESSLIGMIKDASLLLGILSGLAFFIFGVIIEWALPQYASSISLLSMTFIAIPYIMVSKILIANLYKSQRTEKKYFIDSVVYAALSFVFVFGIYSTTNSMMAIAFATTICYVLWYLYTSRKEFSFMRGDVKELLVLASHMIWFYVCSNHMTYGIGMIAYTMYCLLILFVSRHKLQSMVQIVKKN